MTGNGVIPFGWLLDKTISTYVERDGTSANTKFVIHRVAKFPESRNAVVHLMMQQAADASEALAFAQQRPNLAKLILWGRYVPINETQVPSQDRVAPDLVIEPDVGLTEQQFCDWLEAANACKQRCCEAKHVLDRALAEALRCAATALQLVARPARICSQYID